MTLIQSPGLTNRLRLPSNAPRAETPLTSDSSDSGRDPTQFRPTSRHRRPGRAVASPRRAQGTSAPPFRADDPWEDSPRRSTVG